MAKRLLPTLLLVLTACSARVQGEPFVPTSDDDTTQNGGDTAPGDTPPDELPPPPLVIDAANSLLVNDRVAFARVEEEFTMGKLMLGIGAFIEEQTVLYNSTHIDQREHYDRDEFALHPFKGGSTDTQAHNKYRGVKVGVTPVIRDSNLEMILEPAGEKPWAPTKDERGPFRMLAVVNRLDLAGDFDRRNGGQFAGKERRWFGEGRLLFGLTRDRDDGAYPMTFIVEYRLPAIKKSADGTVVVDDTFDFVAGPTSDQAWKEVRKLWAEQWVDLSRYDRQSSTYQQKLRDIVALFAIGSHSVGLRSGERVQTPEGVITNELEYREHYLNDNWMLSNRKVRREPFRCAQMSTALVNRVESDWNEASGELHYDYLLGERNIQDEEIQEIAGLCGGEMPFGQGEEGDPPFQLRAKFVRFTIGEVWVTQLDEERRHAFAMGTCTGCHSAETGSEGFLIAPRLAGENSKIAPFLAGGSQFSSNGVDYTYDELGRRHVLLERFLGLEDVAGEMLAIQPE